MRPLEAYGRSLARRNVTGENLRHYLGPARRFLASFGKPVRKARRRDVERFLADMRLRGVSGVTLATTHSRLRSFFSFLVGEGVLEDDPTKGLPLDRPKSPPQLVLSREAVTKLLAAASENPAHRQAKRPIFEALRLRDRAALELLYGLGLRVSEVAAIRVLDLRLEEGEVVVRPAKRGTPRSLPLPPSSVPHLKSYLAARPALLRGSDDGALLVGQYGTGLRDISLREVVYRVAARAGVRAHPHAFRRALATHLLREGVPVEAVRQVLGHRHLSSTAIYLETDLDDMRKAVSVLEPEDAP